MRRTKIVATLGPATDPVESLDRVIAAGVDVVRLNYSHQSHELHERRYTLLRERARAHGLEIGVIGDLQGPKIRLEAFVDGQIHLDPGDRFTIDANHPSNEGVKGRVGVTYKDLPKDVVAGDNLLVDDGRIVLKVDRVVGQTVECTVQVGGTLSNNKGINREGGGLSAKALTEKDRDDLLHAVRMGCDFIAISFPRNAEDVKLARQLVELAGGKCGIIAKIERAEAVENAAEIIRVADGIMIARGDLGVEIGDAALPPVQKRLIKMARQMNCFVVTATQMMDSMVENPIPTRAEVFDVANAVLDGTDAVMLSAETSIGKYPDLAVAAMARCCVGSESEWTESDDASCHLDHFDRVDEAISKSAMFCANRLQVKAIASLTETGATCRWMSRISSAIPIFAFTQNVSTLRRSTIFRGVYPIPFGIAETDYFEVTKGVLDLLIARGVVKRGDRVIITKGDQLGQTGGTNLMKVVTVGDFVEHVG
jgi:pyruvate kinase